MVINMTPQMEGEEHWASAWFTLCGFSSLKTYWFALHGVVELNLCLLSQELFVRFEASPQASGEALSFLQD